MDIWVSIFFLIIMNNLLWTVVYKFLCESVLISLWYIPRNGIAESYMVMLFHCLRNCQAAFQSGVPFYIPNSNIWEFQFLHILNNVCYCLNFFILAMLVGVKLYHFDVHFPWWLTMLSIFFVLMAICVSTLEKCLFKYFVHYLIGLSFYYWVVRTLYVLDMSSLSEIRFANLFSHPVGCLFTLLMVSGFRFDEVQYICFFLYCLHFWGHLQEAFPKSMPNPVVKIKS